MKTREEIFDGLKKAIREMEERNIGLTQPSWEAILLAAAYLEGKHNWIPVEERLPKENEEVLAYNAENEEVIACDYHHKMFHCWPETFGKSITHWMPMPQPPRKEANNDS